MVKKEMDMFARRRHIHLEPVGADDGLTNWHLSGGWPFDAMPEEAT